MKIFKTLYYYFKEKKNKVFIIVNFNNIYLFIYIKKSSLYKIY